MFCNFQSYAQFSSDWSTTPALIMNLSHYDRDTGEVIHGLESVVAPLPPWIALNQNNSFSVMYSLRTKSPQVMLGPARFINRQCVPNAEV